tara:strand:- start:1120 stop:1467 length:348 start_codon:yes stop_codon:yes gene_type:complete
MYDIQHVFEDQLPTKSFRSTILINNLHSGQFVRLDFSCILVRCLKLCKCLRNLYPLCKLWLEQYLEVFRVLLDRVELGSVQDSWGWYWEPLGSEAAKSIFWNGLGAFGVVHEVHI